MAEATASGRRRTADAERSDWLSFFILFIQIQTTMIKNYLKIALRNARKHSLYTLINILGLTVALTGALFLLLYVTDELSYDQHHQHADRIYRVAMDAKFGESERKVAVGPAALAPALQATYPEVEAYALVRPIPNFQLKKEDQVIAQSDVFYASATLFDVFSYTLLQGDPQTALVEPNCIVINQRLAKKYFGNTAENVVGKSITREDGSVYQVTGLMADMTQNGHFTPTALVSIWDKEKTQSWSDWNWGNYILVQLDFSPVTFQDKLERVAAENMASTLAVRGNAKITFVLQHLTDIHFYSRRDFEFQANDGNMAYIYTFSIVAFFLILLAAINYINLATARAFQRAKEVGVRKTLGAERWQLVWQFLAESFLYTFLAVLLSLSLLYLLSPVFGYFSGKAIAFEPFTRPIYLLWLAGLVGVLTLLSGAYPAFFLSRFRPSLVLKGAKARQENVFFRKILVISQFTISLVLITSTLIVYAQLNYLHQQDLGFDKEQVVKISMGQEAQDHILPLRDALLQNPNIKSVGTTGYAPGDKPPINTFMLETETGMQNQIFQQIWVDQGFIPTLDIQILAGRNFYDRMPADTTLAGVLVNETLVEKLGWNIDNAIGKKIQSDKWADEVIGVVKDFHMTSLHDVVEPLIIRHSTPADQLLIKVSGHNIRSTIDDIHRIWNKMIGKTEIDYTFLDQHFQQQYEKDEKRGNLFASFSGMIIFIACLGLFGLATFTAEQRTKEIGIRKVMGASVTHILVLLSKDYMQLLIISMIIAIPVANYFITDWLKGFAYKIPLQWWMFVLPGVMVLWVALLSISSKTFKAARKNPVDSLRYE